MGLMTAITIVAVGFVALLGLAIVSFIYTGRIDLTRLISEPTGDASMSRFQLLIFTFVIALSFFLIIASSATPGFPDIPSGVLTLLGISASSYLVSKGIQFSQPEGVEDRPVQVTVAPSHATLRGGETKQFKAEVIRTQNKDVEWSVVPPVVGQIDESGLYRAPDQIPAGVATAIVQATSIADRASVDTATVHFRVEP